MRLYVIDLFADCEPVAFKNVYWLKKATEIATAMETAARDAVELQQQLKPNNAVHVMTKNKSSSCYRCGKKGHTSDNCRFKDATCHSCGKAGHIAPVCRSKPTRTPSNKPQPHQKCKGRVKVMEEVPNMEDDDDDILIARISIHTIGRTACDTSTAVFVTLHLNKTPVKMEVDTGSAITILSMADYKKYLPNEKLLQTKVKLQTYTGETVTPVGLIEVNVSYNKQHYTGKLYIVEGGGPPLLGRDWLAHIKLDWPNLLAISTVQPSTTTEEKLKSLLDEYPDLFSDEIGELKDIKGKLTLKENVQPVFMKVRQVPYALRPKVEAELVKLQRQNIITPVENSEWATPIVPVPRPNGGVRICGDFKVTSK